MALLPLNNHLLAHRKRTGLSQEEVAFLLGLENGAQVCRFERFLRTPTLEMALALEAIFCTPVSELFPGLYQVAKDEVRAEAKVLFVKPGIRKKEPQALRKREALLAILSSQSKNPQK